LQRRQAFSLTIRIRDKHEIRPFNK
jgi:hypothetical protein